MYEIFQSIIGIPTPFNMIVLVVLIGSVAGVLTGIAAQIRKYGCHRQDIDFKRELVERGLAAEEIERIVAPNRQSVSRPKKRKFSADVRPGYRHSVQTLRVMVRADCRLSAHPSNHDFSERCETLFMHRLTQQIFARQFGRLSLRCSGTVGFRGENAQSLPIVRINCYFPRLDSTIIRAYENVAEDRSKNVTSSLPLRFHSLRPRNVDLMHGRAVVVASYVKTVRFALFALLCFLCFVGSGRAADAVYSDVAPDQHMKEWLLLGPIPAQEADAKPNVDERAKDGTRAGPPGTSRRRSEGQPRVRQEARCARRRIQMAFS